MNNEPTLSDEERGLIVATAEAVLEEGATGMRRANAVAVLALEATIVELEGIIDTYPKTADGVSLRFGDGTWGPNHAGVIVEWKWGVLPWNDAEWTHKHFNQYYSTREAAEAAYEFVEAAIESVEVDDE